MSAKRISYKSGVKLNGIQQEMAAALPVIANQFHTLDYDCTFTSVTDGKHSANSLHYVGLAVDCRTRHMEGGDKPRVAALLREALGSDFDVVIESTHIHVEYDPE